MASVKRRALHFVFKVADRAETAKFYREILGMKVLRHEEFSEGCQATCNGPYNNRWSKTMVGYGPEETHFAIELTYNYGVHEYDKGNDFIGIVIKSTESIARAKALNWPFTKVPDGKYLLQAPGGYHFYIIDEPEKNSEDPIDQVILSSTNIEKTLYFWNSLLEANVYGQDLKEAVVGYKRSDIKIKFKLIQPIDYKRGTAFGRIAFSVPDSNLEPLQTKLKLAKQKIHTPLTVLDTPGKAAVTVVILEDPDHHEICFVGEENFRILSKEDKASDACLNHYIQKDKS